MSGYLGKVVFWDRFIEDQSLHHKIHILEIGQKTIGTSTVVFLRYALVFAAPTVSTPAVGVASHTVSGSSSASMQKKHDSECSAKH